MFKKYLETREIKNGDKGIFCSIQIPANSAIVEITGTVYTTNQLTVEQQTQYLQIGVNSFIGMSGDVDDYLNHHCQPNCRLHIIGNRAILFSMYVINPNNELTVDYATTILHNDNPTVCKCGSYQCRKTVGGFDQLSSELQEQYKSKGMVPMWILNPNLFAPRE